MAVKVGEGYIEVETRVDEDAFMRLSGRLADRAGAQFGSRFNSSLLSNMNVSDVFEKEGRRASAAFEREQMNSFSRVTEAYRRGLASLGDDTHRSFSRVNTRISHDIDRDSHSWGRTIGHNMSEGAFGLMSLLPARLENLFLRSGFIGVALGGVLLAGAAAALPAIGAMVSGAMFSVAGLGAVIAAGFVGAANDQRVKDAAGRVAATFTSHIINDPSTAGIGAALAAQLDKVNEALHRWAPSINSILNAGAKFFGPLTDGLIRAVDAFLPAFDRFMNSPFMTDLMNVVANGLEILGKAFGDVFNRFLDDPEAMRGAVLGLEDAFNLVASAIRLGGDALIFLSKTWADWNTDPDGPGPLVSKVERMKQLWSDIRSIITDITGELKIAGGKIEEVTGFAKKLKDDLADVGQLWDGIFGRQRGDANGDAEGMGDTTRGFWANQWEDLKAEAKIAWNTTWGDIKALGLQKWREFTTELAEEMGIWKSGWNSFTTEVKNAWNNDWGSIKSTFSSKWSEMKTEFGEEINIWQERWNTYTTGMSFVWGTTWSTIRTTVSGAWAGILSAITSGLETIKGTIAGALSVIASTWDSVFESIKATTSRIWNSIVEIVSGALRAMGERIGSWIAAIQEAWSRFLKIISDIWTIGFTAISNFLSNTLNTMSNIVSVTFNTIVTTISTWINLGRSIIEQVLTSIRTTWNDVWNGMLTFMAGIWDRIVTAVRAGFNGVIGIINAGIAGINTLLDKLGLGISIPTIPGLAVGGVVNADNRTSIRGNATGGRIDGPGSETSDSIIRRLSKNEYVIRAWSARRLGYQNLDYMNRMGAYPGMAAGGRVGGGNDALLNQHRDHVHVAMNIPPMQWTKIITKAAESGLPFTPTSTYRPGSRGSGGGLDYHSQGKAVDFGGYNQDAFASFWERTAGVIELIHRTNTRDYAIFGSGGGLFGFMNEFLAKGVTWVMENMLDPALNGLAGKLPWNLPGWIMRGGLSMLREGLKTIVQRKYDEAVALGNEPGGRGGGGSVQQWERTVSIALTRLGRPQSWVAPILAKMQTESGGNPRAINNYDSNAQRGDPSRGLMQVIGSTFARYRDPSLSSDIYDPLANITAAINYIIATYGSPFNLPAGGYDGGGPWPHGSFGFNTSGGTEMVLNPSQASALEDRIREENRVIELHLDLGEGISQVVEINLDRYNRATIRPLQSFRRR